MVFPPWWQGAIESFNWNQYLSLVEDLVTLGKAKVPVSVQGGIASSTGGGETPFWPGAMVCSSSYKAARAAFFSVGVKRRTELCGDRCPQTRAFQPGR